MRVGKTRRALAWVLTVVMCLTMLPGTGLAAATDVVAGWTWEAHPFGKNGTTATEADATTQKAGVDAKLTYSNIANNSADTYTASTKSFTVNGWDSGTRYWQIQLNAAYCTDLALSFKAYGSNTGPKNFKAQISTDGTTFYDVTDGAYALASSAQPFSFDLVSADANLNNAPTAYIRLLNTDTTSIKNETTGSGGTSRLYDIQITGTYSNPDALAAPTGTLSGGAREFDGGILVKGDTAPTLTLSAETNAVYYTTDGTMPTKDGTQYTTPIELVTGENTVKAIAVNGDKESEVVTFSYTVLEKTTPSVAHTGTNGEMYAVEGILTLQSGKSIYLQTADGGAVCIYLSAFPSGLTPGSTILAVGTKEVSNKQPRLKNGAYVVTNETAAELPCAEATLADVLAESPDLLSKRVKISNLVLGAVDGDNTPVSDGTNSINIYMCPTLSHKVGSTVNVTAVVGCYKSKQLLVSEASDVEWVADPTAVADPTSTPANGGTVAPGGTVTFASATEGASFTYQVGDDTTTDWSAVTAQTGNTYSVPGDAAEGSTIVIKVKASAASLNESQEVTITLTVKDTPLKNGAHVVIWNPANKKALSSVYTGNYNSGVDVTLDEAAGKLTGFDRSEVWTVGVNEDGTYTFTTLDGGKKLGMGASGQPLVLDGEKDTWKVMETEGGYHIENAGRSGYRIEWYKSKNNWSTYNKNYDDQYIQQFYAVSDEELPMAAVADPVILPASASVTSGDSVKVTIECATADADIYYTTDGTEPTAGSTKFTAAFTLSGLTEAGTTVKAIAVKSGMKDSAVVSKTYKTVSADTDFIQVTDAAELKAGGYFVLVPKEFPTQALSTSFANKPSPVTVSNPPANGEYAPTLKLTPMNDGVSVQYEVTGKYIGYDSNYSTSFQESDTPYQFNVTGPNDDGAFRFIFSTSTSRAISLQGNTGNVFGAYAINNDGNTTTSTDGTITYGPYESDMLVYKSTKGYLYNPHITFGVLNDAVVGQDWSTTYALEETDTVSNLAAQYSLDGTTWTAATLDETAKTVSVPGNVIVAGHDNLYLKITGTDTRGTTVKQMETTAQTAIKDEPMITAVSPAQGAETGAGHLRPTFTATVVNGGTFTAKISIVPKSGAAITDADMTVDTATGVASYTPTGDLAEGWCDVTVTVTRKDGESATKSWSCTVGEAKYVNYFGQLHSHTAEYSDGAGTLASALEYIKNTAYRNNVQFVAFTDHSNYFDTTAAAAPAEALYDVSKLPADAKAKWDAYKKAVADFNKANTGTQVAIAGFEMTWSGGPGHINTFNTPGIVSRNNKDLNNKTNDQGMRDYYSLLSNEKGVESISQFNHPGTTFGTFAEFAYYDPTIDSRITLVEVGNGEGAIGSGGYFPSYSEYIKALDKGWHLAPTNNQDNHKGHWGDANDARTVVYTTDLSENGIYQAMREMRIYATEDKNLDIVYTVNGEKMGTIVNEVPGSAQFKATISDPDVTDKIGTVEIVTNGGAVVYKVENIEAASYELDWTMDAPKAGYYFLRVTQADKDIAVTAPVWLGKAKNVGMSELTCGTAVVVKGEEVTFSNQFFNNEGEAATLLRASYDVNGQLTVNSPNTPISSMGTVDYSFPYTFNTVGKQTVTLTAVVSIGGEEKTLTSSITVDVKDPDKMIYVGIDGSHHNEYVSGNYKDSMGNFTTLAADYEVRVVVLNTSEQLMNALQNEKYKMMVFTTPTRRLELSVMGQAAYDVYSDTELAAITAFAQRGGTVVVTGWGDYYESYDYCPKDASMQMSAQQNALLAAIGSKLRVADDEAKDEVNKPGSNAARLYLTDYNGFKSPLLAGVDPAQVWSQYGGSTVYAVDDSGAPATVLPDTVTPVISGYGKFESDGTGVDLKNIDSHDEDGDGYMNGVTDKTQKPPKYPSDKGTTCLLTATEEVTHANGTKSLVMVSGGAFMSNFEVKFDADNVTQLGYSNPIVLGNLMESLDPKPVRKIADLHAENIPADQEFVVEGVITANTSGYDRETAFFDCTYIQDETGGINVFPVSGNFQVGQRVKVRGIIGGYQGERQLTLSTSDYQGGYIKALSHAPNLTPVTPAQATTKDVAEGKYLGQLVKVQGTVTSVELVNGAVQTIRLKDESDVEARLFIDGYITASKDAALQQRAKVGAKLTAVGLGSYDDTFKEDGSEANRIRIRDRADITGESTGGGSSGSSKDTVVRPGDVKDSEAGVTVALPAADATFTDGAKEKLAELNETKPVTLEGGGLKVVVPAGVIGKDTNPADLLVNPAQAGNAVQVTLPDGTTEIVPFALVTGKSAAYIADKEGSYALVDNAKDFVDVPEDFWGADAVDFTSANELFQGTGDNCFTPDGEMTRAMVVTALARLSGAEVDNAVSVFPDVPADTWYTGAVTWAAQAGIVMGDGTNFDPDAPITREALCAILDRFTAYANLTLNQVSDGEGFADAHTVSDWAKGSVDAAVKTGLVTGRPGKMIDPAGSATRAEVATVFQRLVKAVLG